MDESTITYTELKDMVSIEISTLAFLSSVIKDCYNENINKKIRKNHAVIIIGIMSGSLVEGVLNQICYSLLGEKFLEKKNDTVPVIERSPFYRKVEFLETTFQITTKHMTNAWERRHLIAHPKYHILSNKENKSIEDAYKEIWYVNMSLKQIYENHFAAEQECKNLIVQACNFIERENLKTHSPAEREKMAAHFKHLLYIDKDSVLSRLKHCTEVLQISLSS